MAPAQHPWGSRQGSAAGFSPHSPPSLSSEVGPLVAVPGCNNSPVIDADGCIYATAGDSIAKLSDEGLCLWKATLSKERGFWAGTPALLDGAVLAYTGKGEAVALDVKSGRERWQRVFCQGGALVDINSVAAGAGIMIVAGKENKASADLAFNTDVYALDANTGKEKWKVNVRLGVMCFNPSVAENAVIFQSINGEVACHNLADGEKRWMTKPSGQVSTGGAVFSRVTGFVYSTANKRGKKEWNKPFGGNGCVRALELKSGELKWSTDLDLEANALPAVAPIGPQGKLIVIVPAGANPGTWANPVGDVFSAKVVALDAKDGSMLWESGTQVHMGSGPGGTADVPGSRDVAGVTWTNPVACTNGSIYIAHGNLRMLEINGATGEEICKYGAFPGFTAGVAVGPDMLVFGSARFLYIFRPRLWSGGEILRESDVPFSETGYEHFCPRKMPNLGHTCQLRATTDLSKPTWVAGDIEKHETRCPGMDFYHTTPLVDSQRNIYLATNLSRILIIRPDGYLRGYIDCGAMVSSMCLHEQYLYVANGAGYCVKADIETTDIVWNRRYCDHGSKDPWSLAVCPSSGLLLAMGQTGESGDGPHDGCMMLHAMKLEDGSAAWWRRFAQYCVNILPSIWEENNMLVCADCSGGIYCLRISNGMTKWENQAISEDNEGSFSAAQCVSAPNGVVYHVWNLKQESRFPVWNKGGGCGGKMRAYDLESGDHCWTCRLPHECHATPVVMPLGDRYVVVVALGSQGAHGPSPDGSTLDDEDPAWPEGDAWESCVCGFDGATGQELWRLELPVWQRYEARGSCWQDLFLAPCFGSPTGNADGNVYVIHWSGTVYCLEAQTGKLLSQADVGCASKSAVVMMPGTLLVPTGLSVKAYRDEALELEWLEAARAKGDKRADPQLWERKQHQLTQVDMDLLASVLRTSPAVGVHPKTQYRAFPPPQKACGQDAYEARCKRLEAKEQAFFEALALQAAASKAAAPAPAAPAPAAPAPASKAAAPAPAKAPSASANSWMEAMVGPSDAAAEGPAKAAAAPEGPTWEVVGGGKAGGITVRKEQGLKSEEVGRLANGAKVAQVRLQGERLKYRKVSGDGPDSGWVSLTFKGAALVKRL